MTKPIVDNSALIQLIEVELVNQYKRFISKRIAVAPRNCYFNSWDKMEDGGFNRICQFPHERLQGKPCNTITNAKKCPVYRHYSCMEGGKVIQALTQEFLVRLTDPTKRSNSFKPLHTLWILLHEVEVINLSWFSRIQLKLAAIFLKRSYTKHLIRKTPKADKTWKTLMENFKSLLTSPKE